MIGTLRRPATTTSHLHEQLGALISLVSIPDNHRRVSRQSERKFQQSKKKNIQRGKRNQPRIELCEMKPEISVLDGVRSDCLVRSAALVSVLSINALFIQSYLYLDYPELSFVRDIVRFLRAALTSVPPSVIRVCWRVFTSSCFQFSAVAQKRL